VDPVPEGMADDLICDDAAMPSLGQTQ
jgi:hypothetical protein